ncbi:MAG: PEP-CTERM sorting domain-containing protein [Phycisphaeraceae bacterium]
MKRYLAIFTAALTLAIGQHASAITMTMSATPADLSALTVGDSFQIDVLLGDLGGDEVASLGGSIMFPSAQLGTPTGEVAGVIVPDASDLILTPLAGLMDGQFFAFTGGNITAEGIFYSFTLTAQAPGSGVIEFDAQSLFAELVQQGEIFDISTNALTFTVQERTGGAAVPEPATAGLGLMGLMGLALRRRQTR